MKKYWNHKPHTTTTIWDIKRMFKKHPVKTTFALPVASTLLGGQVILYFATVPFVALHNVLGNY